MKFQIHSRGWSTAFLAGTLLLSCVSSVQAKMVQHQFKEVKLSAPEEWGNMKGEKFAAVPQDDPADMPEGADPEHYQLTFPNYKGSIDIYFIKDSNAPSFKKKFPAYPAAISSMKKLLAEHPAAPKDPPHLPWLDSASSICARVTYPQATDHHITYLRSLQAFQQDTCQITNEILDYMAQGVSSDSNYYVSVICPVHTSVLKDKLTSDNWSKEQWDTFSKGFKAYSAGINKTLDKTPDNAFKPSLTELDQVIESLSIAPPPAKK